MTPGAFCFALTLLDTHINIIRMAPLKTKVLYQAQPVVRQASLHPQKTAPVSRRKGKQRRRKTKAVVVVDDVVVDAQAATVAVAA